MVLRLATRRSTGTDLQRRGTVRALRIGQDQYNIFRWYRSGWGRYTQADPIGLRGGSSLYRYAADNPIKYLDRLGLVCGVYRWRDPDFAGHWWLETPEWTKGFYPDSSFGTWRGGSEPGFTVPIPGNVKDETPGYTDPKGGWERDDTDWDTGGCHDCAKVQKCLNDFASTFDKVNKYCVFGKTCRSFTDDALRTCGLKIKEIAPPGPVNCLILDGKQVCVGTGI
jgi:RHS repeat-associated protein